MGGKSDLNTRMDRPSSGGADHDSARETSGLKELDKETFAQDMAEKHASTPEHPKDGQSAPFSIDNEPNNARSS